MLRSTHLYHVAAFCVSPIDLLLFKIIAVVGVVGGGVDWCLWYVLAILYHVVLCVADILFIYPYVREHTCATVQSITNDYGCHSYSFESSQESIRKTGYMFHQAREAPSPALCSTILPACLSASK